jgi:cytochrome c oxidase assembly factor CtaG
VIGAILTRWSFDPTVLGGLALLCVVYWRAGGRRPWRFAAAIVLSLLALESPLDFLADHYLFSAHMVQHLVLMLGVAPLLALSIPPRLGRWAPRTPVLAFVLFVVDMWLWHAPPLYESTLHNEALHALEHLTFVTTAGWFWWVAFSPEALPMLGRAAYVFVAGIPGTLLGALITFAPRVLYPSYPAALEQPGLGRALQAQWNVTAAGDQQLGGLIMWVPGGLVYLVAILAILLSGLSRQQAIEAEPAS